MKISIRKAIVALIAVAFAAGIAAWLLRPDSRTDVNGDDSPVVTDEETSETSKASEKAPALPDPGEISSIEMIYSKGEYSKGESYICSDKVMIADLIDQMAAASRTEKKNPGDTPQADDYYTVNIRGSDDEETLLTCYVEYEDSETCLLEIPGQGIYSADSDLYFVVGDLVAED